MKPQVRSQEQDERKLVEMRGKNIHLIQNGNIAILVTPSPC